MQEKPRSRPRIAIKVLTSFAINPQDHLQIHSPNKLIQDDSRIDNSINNQQILRKSQSKQEFRKPIVNSSKLPNGFFSNQKPKHNNYLDSPNFSNSPSGYPKSAKKLIPLSVQNPVLPLKKFLDFSKKNQEDFSDNSSHFKKKYKDFPKNFESENEGKGDIIDNGKNNIVIFNKNGGNSKFFKKYDEILSIKNEENIIKNKENLEIVKKNEENNEFFKKTNESSSKNTEIKRKNSENSENSRKTIESSDLSKKTLDSLSKTSEMIEKLPEKFKELQLNEFITLSLLRKTPEMIEKLVFHIPTLNLYVLQEVNMLNFDLSYIKENLEFLKEISNKNPSNFIQIHQIYWNSPEGYISLLREFFNGGTIRELLEFSMILTEKTIQTLIKQLLNILKNTLDFHGLDLSQLLFNKKGDIKLALKIGNNGFYSYKDEIFDLGLLILSCLTNDFDAFGSRNFTKIISPRLIGKSPRNILFKRINNENKFGKIPENQNKIIENNHIKTEKQGKIDKNNEISNKIDKNYDDPYKTCCLFHQMLQNNNNLLQSIIKRYSCDFQDFLCKCLRFDRKEKADIEQLISHKFLKNKVFQGPDLDLSELIRLSCNWSKDLIIPKEFQRPAEEELNRICQAFYICLNDYGGEFEGILAKINEKSHFIKELAWNLGVQREIIVRKFRKVVEKLQENLEKC